eukprot:4271705-Amphidinium_carterae.1
MARGSHHAVLLGEVVQAVSEKDTALAFFTIAHVLHTEVTPAYHLNCCAAAHKYGVEHKGMTREPTKVEQRSQHVIVVE